MRCCLGFKVQKGSDLFMVGEPAIIKHGVHAGQRGSFVGDWGTKMITVVLENDATKKKQHLLFKSCAKYCPEGHYMYLHNPHYGDVQNLRNIYVDMVLHPWECPKCKNRNHTYEGPRPCAAEAMRDLFKYIAVSLLAYDQLEISFPLDCWHNREQCRNVCESMYTDLITKEGRWDSKNTPPCVRRLLVEMFPHGTCNKPSHN